MRTHHLRRQRVRHGRCSCEDQDMSTSGILHSWTETTHDGMSFLVEGSRPVASDHCPSSAGCTACLYRPRISVTLTFLMHAIRFTLHHWVTHENASVTGVLSKHARLSHMLLHRLRRKMHHDQYAIAQGRKRGEETHLMRSAVGVESRFHAWSTATACACARRWCSARLKRYPTRLCRNRREPFILE